MAAKQHRTDEHRMLRSVDPTTQRKSLRGGAVVPRHACRELAERGLGPGPSCPAEKCSQTRLAADFGREMRKRLDCKAAMLQAIRVGRGIPMLEPWIIDEIRRREEERRRGDRPQLELPVPDSEWPPQGDFGDVRERDEQSPERGVVIIGM
jgi:hypothetical protein